MSKAPQPEDTLEYTRQWVSEESIEGVQCPACDQHAKVYRRKISSSIAEVLIAIHHVAQRTGEEFVHVPSLRVKNGREVSKLTWWGFVEEAAAIRDDGGRAGFWRVTPEGEKWLKNLTTAPKYAVTYNGRLLEMTEDERVTILDALGSKFNYRELMDGV